MLADLELDICRRCGVLRRQIRATNALLGLCYHHAGLIHRHHWFVGIFCSDRYSLRWYCRHSVSVHILRWIRYCYVSAVLSAFSLFQLPQLTQRFAGHLFSPGIPAKFGRTGSGPAV